VKYTIGIFIGLTVGVFAGYLFKTIRNRDNDQSAKFEVSPYLSRIGELRVFRAYFKEIVTSVDHIWGDVGKKYFSWFISEKKLAMVFEFEVDFIYDLQSPDLSIKEGIEGISLSMPKCKYDVKIKDFYFYDEQSTRIKLLPEILSNIFEGGSSEEKKNELIKMSIKQVEQISKKVASSLQYEVHNVTKETISNLFSGVNKKISNLSFQEMKIIEEQIHIENPKVIEDKLS
jgi:hypothetical protein